MVGLLLREWATVRALVLPRFLEAARLSGHYVPLTGRLVIPLLATIALLG